MTPLAALARALGGDVVGRQVLAPGPGHTRRDRSLAVRLVPSAPEGFVVFSHAGDAVGACRDHVRDRMGWQRPDRRQQRPAPIMEPVTAPSLDELANVVRAAAIWREAVDPRGTVVETYLASRGLELPDEAAGEAIRFHEACPWFDRSLGTTTRVPAMIAALTSYETGELTGVYRTRLTPDGRKVERRMLGRAAGAAVMLCPFEAVGAGLAIGEGVESCLAAMAIGWRSAWALGSVGAIASFPLLPGLQSLVLLAETGDGGASARAIDAVGRRYVEDGREVIIVEPRCGGDLNDALRSAA